MKTTFAQTAAPERKFTDVFNRLVSTGKLREVVHQLIPILGYHARETIYRAGNKINHVHDTQFVRLPTGEFFKVSLNVDLVEEPDELDEVSV